MIDLIEISYIPKLITLEVNIHLSSSAQKSRVNTQIISSSINHNIDGWIDGLMD